MKKPRHTGNVTLILANNGKNHASQILLVLKPSKIKGDNRRRRRRVGAGLWVPPGGATDKNDESQKHSAQRELMEETGMKLPLRLFTKAAILKGYVGTLDSEPLWLVHIYLVILKNKPEITTVPKNELLKAEWFSTSELPFSQMLPGDSYWIPRVVAGEKLMIRIAFENTENNLNAKIISRVRSFN